MSKKKTFFWSVFVYLLILGSILWLSLIGFKPKRVRAGSCSGCNVIILDLDVLRYDALDCQNKREATPNFCKLVDESVYYKNHANQSGLTITSFVTANTSLYPSSHGIWNDSFDPKTPNVKYLAEILKDANYQTTMAGRIYWQSPAIGFDQEIKARHVFEKQFKPVEWVKDLASSDKPFLLNIYLDDLHFPYLLFNDEVIPNDHAKPDGLPLTSSDFTEMQEDYVAQHYKDIFTDEAISMNKDLFSGNLMSKKGEILDLFFEYSSREGKAYLLKDIWASTRDTYFQNFDQNNPEHIAYLKDNYLGVLHLVDRQLGDFLNYISESGLDKNTIVIFRSDHGEEFLEHGLFQHGNNLYQELVHTPLAIKVPGVKPARAESLVEDVDILPTLLELLGVQTPLYAQGTSLIPTMNDPNFKIRNYQLAQKGASNYVAMFRKENWKVITKEGSPIGLYNLTSDPNEIINLVSIKTEKADEMNKEYHKIIDTLPLYGPSRSNLPDFVNDEKRQRLRDEGYF